MVSPSKPEGSAKSHEPEYIDTAWYDEFELPFGVRRKPGGVEPRAGYSYRTLVVTDAGNNKCSVPLIRAAITRKEIMDVFDDLIELFDDEVNVYIQTSHHPLEPSGEYSFEEEDLSLVRHRLGHYDELLTDDGHTGIAVVGNERSSDEKMEVLLCTRKLIGIFGSCREPFESILKAHGLAHDPDLIFANESPYANRSTRKFLEQFNNMVDDFGGHSWDAEDPFSHA